MVEVIVAEPNALLRFSMKSALEGEPDIALAAEVTDAEQLTTAMLRASYDVMLIGLGLLREIGVGPFRELRRIRPVCRIVVHSYEWDAGFGTEAARFGATGYFSNECSNADLRAAVLDVGAGRPFVTPSLGAALAEAACFRADELRLARLSARERKVFIMLTIGIKPRGIAAQLGVPVQDVLDCKWRIMAKIDLPDAGELARHAIAQTCRYRPQPALPGERAAV
jgi:two-component system, NarL family, invasion response regulator UvrY